MRCLKRNKRTIYLCTEYQDGEIAKYHEPQKIKINYQATNSDGDLVALGLDFPKYIRIKADLKYANVFHPKDRVYINTVPTPITTTVVVDDEEQEIEVYDELCKDADYEVDSDPIVSLNIVEITLKRLSGKTDGFDDTY